MASTQRSVTGVQFLLKKIYFVLIFETETFKAAWHGSLFLLFVLSKYVHQMGTR